MENQLPLMPSPVILLQIFIVEGFFSCLFEKGTLAREQRGRGGEAAFQILTGT